MVFKRPCRLAFFPVQDQLSVSFLSDNLCSKASNDDLFHYHFKLYHTVKVNLLRKTVSPAQIHSYFLCSWRLLPSPFPLWSITSHFVNSIPVSTATMLFAFHLPPQYQGTSNSHSLCHPLFFADIFFSAELLLTCHLPSYADHYTQLHPSSLKAIPQTVRIIF